MGLTLLEIIHQLSIKFVRTNQKVTGPHTRKLDVNHVSSGYAILCFGSFISKHRENEQVSLTRSYTGKVDMPITFFPGYATLLPKVQKICAVNEKTKKYLPRDRF